MFFNLNDAISEAATRSIGFTGADLDTMKNTSASAINSTGNTAIDQIQLTAGVTPDVVNTTWIVSMYSTVAEWAMIVFYIFFVIGLCAILLNHWSMLPASHSANIMHFLKKIIIVAFMVYQGLPILMTLLLMNQWTSEIFGGTLSVTDIMVQALVSPLGCVIVTGSCAAIAWNAIFYTVRLLLILISCGVWPIAWILWMWDRTSQFAVFLLTIIVVNIFLGAAMCLVYWIGTLFLVSPEASGWLSSWGAQIVGLLIMFVAGMIPVLAFWYIIFNPVPSVKKVVYTMAAA